MKSAFSLFFLSILFTSALASSAPDDLEATNKLIPVIRSQQSRSGAHPIRQTSAQIPRPRALFAGKKYSSTVFFAAEEYGSLYVNGVIKAVTKKKVAEKIKIPIQRGDVISVIAYSTKSTGSLIVDMEINGWHYVTGDNGWRGRMLKSQRSKAWMTRKRGYCWRTPQRQSGSRWASGFPYKYGAKSVWPHHSRGSKRRGYRYAFLRFVVGGNGCVNGLISGSRHSGSRRSGSRHSGSKRSGSKRSGSKRSGIRRSGIRRSGIRRSGIRRSGSRRSGSRHSGSRHSGSRHSGSRHSGSRHSGSRHSGSRRSGSRRSGSRRSGSRRSGSRRSGSRRSGSRRSGSRRSGSRRSGSRRSESRRSESRRSESRRSGSRRSGSRRSGSRPSGSRPSGRPGRRPVSAGKFCRCRMMKAKKGVCYELNKPKQTFGRCKPRTCERSYECVTRISRNLPLCVRRYTTEKVAHVKRNYCRKISVKQAFYVPYQA